MEYWKPEHPPPTTPIRNPAGTGFCEAIISLTFAIAAGVRVTGVVEAGAPTTTSGVTVAVDIGKSPCLKSDIFKCMRPPTLRQALTHKCCIYRCAPITSDSAQPQKTLHLLISATIFPASHRKDMKFIQFIANAFINTMGITQPSPQAANRAAWFIVIMLSAVLAAVITVALVATHWAAHH